jgi:hypothetical protein
MFRRRHDMRWLSAAAVTGVALACAAPAGATGTYPGETLSLSMTGKAVVGQEILFTASGQQTDFADYAGGFNLDVYAKDPSVDPTCAPAYTSEIQAATGDPTESQPVIGLWQGSGMTFSTPFKLFFSHPGRVLLCAYSTWITDTAASATLTVDVVSPVTRPVDVTAPKITRSGKQLHCSRGTWTGASSFAYSFAWLVNGRPKKGARKATLAVTKALKHDTVKCRVTASDAVGKATATSQDFKVK